MIDVRALGNFVLDRADEMGASISNMALNKIVYFVHCDYMLENEMPLVGAKIEAWQHGPVFRELYHQFKKWGDGEIRGRAVAVSPITGEAEVATVSFGTGEKKKIIEIIDRYIHFSAAHLRALSHASGGPWDAVWGHDGRANPGMQITNDMIRTHYVKELLQ